MDQPSGGGDKLQDLKARLEKLKKQSGRVPRAEAPQPPRRPKTQPAAPRPPQARAPKAKAPRGPKPKAPRAPKPRPPRPPKAPRAPKTGRRPQAPRPPQAKAPQARAPQAKAPQPPKPTPLPAKPQPLKPLPGKTMVEDIDLPSTDGPLTDSDGFNPVAAPLADSADFEPVEDFADEGLPPGFRDFKTMAEDEEGAPPPSAHVAPDPEPTASGTGAPRSGSGTGSTARQQKLVERAVPGSSIDGAAPKSIQIEPGTIFEVRPGLKLVLERVLGEGGMGVVYLVRDPKLGRRMALKLIRGEQSSARIVRFARETQVTACLNHPGIPPVNEAGQTEAGIHYLLMRFVSGESLKKRLRRLWGGRGGRRPDMPQIRELLQALVRIGEAVAYAHNERVIHRDLKPENIMIGEFGEVFVMDWGLARNLDESIADDASICESLLEAPKAPKDEADSEILAASKDLTRVGATLGTIGYMAPEQARGEVIDHRADVFALGVILTRILTGRSALGDDPGKRFDNTLANQILSPREIDSAVPGELDAIAARATAPARHDRYESAEDFVDDVQAYLEGQKVGAYRYRPVDEVVRAVKRHPAVMVGIVGLLLLAVALWMIDRNRTAELRDYLSLGKAALEQGEPQKAFEQFNKALGVDSGNLAAKLGKMEAEKAIGKAIEGEHDRVSQKRDQEKAERYERDAEAALQREDFQAAMEASDLAVAFGSDKGKELRKQAHQGVAAELAKRRAEEYRARARERVKAGKLLADQGKPQEALRAYHQALAFDVENEDAKQGVANLAKKLANWEAQQEKLARQKDALKEVAVADQIREKAKQAYLKGVSILKVLDQHLLGLEAVDRALFLDPESKPAKLAKQQLGQQLAAILRQEGHSQFEADFVLRFSGTKPGTSYTKVPRDPHLEIREGDAVRIRQVLGTTRFKRTRRFDPLRKYVARTFPNHRIVIVIRSKPIPGNPIPQIQLKGIWVQVEDKIARTVRPPHRLPIEGRYIRPMSTDKLGRIIGSWDESRQQSRIDARPIVQRVEQLARKLLRLAKR